MKYTEEAYQLTDEENVAPRVSAPVPQRSSRAGFAAGALAHLGRTAQRPGAAELLDEVAASSGKPTVHAYADAL